MPYISLSNLYIIHNLRVRQLTLRLQQFTKNRGCNSSTPKSLSGEKIYEKVSQVITQFRKKKPQNNAKMRKKGKRKEKGKGKGKGKEKGKGVKIGSHEQIGVDINNDEKMKKV